MITRLIPRRGPADTQPCRRCGCSWDIHTHYRTPGLNLRAVLIFRRYGVTVNECALCECPEYQRPRRPRFRLAA